MKEPELPKGMMHLHLVCRGCNAKKRLTVPAAPMPVGEPLGKSWGQRAVCIRCRKSQMIIQNSCPEDKPVKKAVGFRGMREPGDPKAAAAPGLDPAGTD